MKMWEILVPTEMKTSLGTRPIKTRYHRVWDAKIRAISGGITILSPVKGQWISRKAELYQERMIPVRIIATDKQIEQIINITIKYYNQEAVLAYKISDEVLLVHRK